MTYGIEIKNNSDRVIIDQAYPNLYLVSEIASLASAGSAYPTTNYGTDLIIGRPYLNQNGFISLCVSGGKYWVYSTAGDPYNYGYVLCKPPLPSSGYNYYTLRKVNGNQNPLTSGFGLTVYDGSGNAQFNATANNKIAELVSVGVLSGTKVGSYSVVSDWATLISNLEAGGETGLVSYYPSSTGVLTNLSSYHVAVSSCFRHHLYADFGVGSTRIDLVSGFEYIWTGSDTGRIRIVNFGTVNSAVVQGNRAFNYQIFKVNG